MPTGGRGADYNYHHIVAVAGGGGGMVDCCLISKIIAERSRGKLMDGALPPATSEGTATPPVPTNHGSYLIYWSLFEIFDQSTNHDEADRHQVSSAQRLDLRPINCHELVDFQKVYFCEGDRREAEQ